MTPTYFCTFLILLLCAIQSLHNAAAGRKRTTLNAVPVHKNEPKSKSRIVGGKAVKPPHSYPSIVLMSIGNNPSCGATILSSEWVLSAAHCTIKDNAKEYTFFAGKHDKSKTEPSEQKVTCVEFWDHENYDEDTFRNDISIFRVSPPFKFNEYVKPVVLPPSNWDKTGKSTPVGWGRIGEYDPTANILQEASVPILTNKDCSKMMEDIFETSLCAGSEGGKDACQGDSGGPLYYKEGSETIQIGIVSWGDGCAQKGKAGIYTRVTKYLDWIKKKMSATRRRGVGTAVGRGAETVEVVDVVEVTEGGAAPKKKESKGNRIVGGEDTKPNEYPSIVLMGIYGQPSCAGSIYNTEWVLSAGHCVISMDPADFTFFAGKHDKYKTEPGEQKTTCVQVVRHEDYDTETLANDIAMFKVSPPFKLSNNIKAVELPPEDWNQAGDATAVGWGRIAEGGATAEILQHVVLPIIPNDKCTEIMDDVYNTSLCAGVLGGGKDACQGDSGGPLYFKEKDKKIQIGVVSWGVGCAREGNAGLYTRVSKYLSWIKSTANAKARSGRTEGTALVFKAGGKKSRTNTLTDAQVEKKEQKLSRIVGGAEVKPHEFPSIVLLVFNGRPICGGTIIDKEWVVSAAHCLLSTDPSNFVFIAGKHDKYNTEPTEQKVTAEMIVKHSAYSNNPYNNDIVLYKVSPPFVFNENVKVAKLAKSGMNPEGMAIPVGWGATSQGGGSAALLQKVEVPIITNDKCKEKYGTNQVFPGSLCAGFDEGKKDACQGDSGGPLYFMEGSEQILIGITSWGKGCAKANQPGVYTRVSHYLPWIDEHSGLSFEKGTRVITGGAASSGSDSGATGGKKQSISNSVVTSVCKQVEEYSKDKTIAKPVKFKPQDAGVKCGWFKWTKGCDESCKPFNTAVC